MLPRHWHSRPEPPPNRSTGSPKCRATLRSRAAAGDARALEAVGQHDEAAVVRAQVLSLCAEDPTDRELALLTLLDEERTAGEPVEELVADLQNQPAVAPIAVTGLTTDEIARRYAGCSRY